MSDQPDGNTVITVDVTSKPYLQVRPQTAAID